MDKEFILTAIAMAFFIICPRMAGIVHVICKYSELPPMKTALLGSVIAIPLILLMVWVFSKTGVTGALIFCVVTDLASAFLIQGISLKASIDTIVIAAFVLVAVKVAPFISGAIIK